MAETSPQAAPKPPRSHHPLALWLAARRDYVEGLGTLPDIARKHGLPVQTVQTRGKREHWSTARAAFVKRKTAAPDAELPPTPQPPSAPTDSLSLKIARLNLQIERLDQMIEAENDDRKLTNLVTAKKGLEELWARWSGIPLPGSRRVAPDRRNQRRPSLSGPLDVQSAVAESQASPFENAAQ